LKPPKVSLLDSVGVDSPLTSSPFTTLRDLRGGGVGWTLALRSLRKRLHKSLPVLLQLLTQLESPGIRLPCWLRLA